ncbi:unnamed protein product (macronuclear) [Paramecium tetraurelia]|uniref:Uncharacterized protein n=1 Tax=Paramecium tetraurelia TaxID=5888 RepID=A0D1Y8_PARTE|nr:uncharacterized protein GSPATT00039189001 [Paramecium tetraurelia]CAK77055.1 unnamed protein product [Paramecium tetraurelia]|eukprot:XP_001444452.1 hypothetical protein (macronuclear) [Paramecium tetraurelia strain d4-2]
MFKKKDLKTIWIWEIETLEINDNPSENKLLKILENPKVKKSDQNQSEHQNVLDLLIDIFNEGQEESERNRQQIERELLEGLNLACYEPKYIRPIEGINFLPYTSINQDRGPVNLKGSLPKEFFVDLLLQVNQEPLLMKTIGRYKNIMEERSKGLEQLWINEVELDYRSFLVRLYAQDKATKKQYVGSRLKGERPQMWTRPRNMRRKGDDQSQLLPYDDSQNNGYMNRIVDAQMQRYLILTK